MTSRCNTCPHIVKRQPHKARLYSMGRMYYYCELTDKLIAINDSWVPYKGRKTPVWCPEEAENGNGKDT